MTAIGNDYYIYILEEKIKEALISIVRSGRQLSGCNWLLRRVLSFARSRIAANALIEAMLHILKQPVVNNQTHFIELLSCLKSMIKFDDYDYNEASADKILGKAPWKKGCIRQFVENNNLSYADIGILSMPRLHELAHMHMEEIKSKLAYITEKVNADDNGINFAIKVPTNDGKVKYIVAWYSNYNRATEFIRFKKMNDGRRHFLTKKQWLEFIHTKLIPKFKLGMTTLRKIDDGVEAADEGDDRSPFLDFSIKNIKHEVKCVFY
jgi:hypothetical protein